MAKVYEFLATGFEEIEALIPLDVMRRAGIDFSTVSVTGNLIVKGTHGVDVKADYLFEDLDFEDADLLLLPGGLPGATNLNVHEGLKNVLLSQNEKKKMIGAICAAPLVLGGMGLLRGKQATCYPGFESHLLGASYTHELVTVDGNIITGEGPAAAFPYAFSLLSLLKTEEASSSIEDGMMYTHLME
ncbi:MAG: DJ-1/PfpI family protein [Prevotella sp.]|nr:DJ-1/PfpI family protein [Prevotella sp.]